MRIFAAYRGGTCSTRTDCLSVVIYCLNSIQLQAMTRARAPRTDASFIQPQLDSLDSNRPDSTLYRQLALASARRVGTARHMSSFPPGQAPKDHLVQSFPEGPGPPDRPHVALRCRLLHALDSIARKHCLVLLPVHRYLRRNTLEFKQATPERPPARRHLHSRQNAALVGWPQQSRAKRRPFRIVPDSGPQ